ncbi:hypothetical protein SAMN05216532_4001 [Streptomyces sp. 2231.1]|uniref:hypothetical protein n=1 Tax=Streptomyces sp. 2231.1 TaxID=1855347 RepID=UPI000897215D|nr:hypothetical protein [Streptomyces sp. 2231.1]SED26634.1 hypothetical protein SAMN05216532_4001 [Streptomyces sp. 2231.1]
MESIIKALVGLKLVGLVLFVIAVAIGIGYTLAAGPEEPESTHGSTAVCKDGTVLSPPWNACGEEHGYLDHWTSRPAPTAAPAIPSDAPVSVPDTDEDDWLTAYPSGCEGGTPIASPWDPCGNLP